MNFDDILADEQDKHATRLQKHCKTGAWFDTLDEKTRASIYAAKNNPKVTQPVMFSACKRIGLPVGPSALYHHLRGECSCDRQQ